MNIFLPRNLFVTIYPATTTDMKVEIRVAVIETNKDKSITSRNFASNSIILFIASRNKSIDIDSTTFES